MKAITTGFAITALALAVSGQAAAADTEATYEFSGEINVSSTMDLLDSVRYNTIEDEDDGDNDAFELTINTKVTNGPFSGTLVIREEEPADDSATLDYSSVDIFIEDLMVEEGNVSFGQIGSIIATDDLIDALTDEANEGMSYDVDGGIRYTDSDMGLTVQAEAADDHADAVIDNAFGVSVNFTQEIDMGTVYAEIQHSESIDFGVATPENTSADMLIGVGAVLNVVEGVEVTAVYQSATVAAYGVGVVYTAGAITANASYGEPDADTADNEVIMLGGSFAADMLTFSGSYKMVSDTTGDVEVDVDYANDNISANAGYEMSLVDGDDSTAIDLSVALTSESGVVYEAAFDQNTDAAGADSAQAITLSAAYSF